MDTDQPVVPPGFKLIKSPDQAPASDVQVPPGFKLVQGGGADAVGPPEAKDMPGTVAFGARQNLAANAANAPPSTPPLEGVGKRAASGLQFVNPVSMVRGLAKGIVQPGAALEADQAARQRIEDEAGESIAKGQTTKGIAKHVFSTVPLAGPIVSGIGDKWESGDLVGALSDLGGFMASIYGPSKLRDIPIPGRGILASTATKLQRRAIPPRGTTPEQDAAITATTLREGISPDFLGGRRMKAAAGEAGQEIGQITTGAPQTPSISGPDVQAAIGKLRTGRTPVGGLQGPALGVDLGEINAVENEFLQRIGGTPGQVARNLTPAEAQALKTEAQSAATSIRQSAYQKGVKPKVSGTVETYQTVADNLGEQLVNQFPDLSAPYARYAAIKEIGPSVKSAIKSAARHGKVSVLLGIATGLVTSPTHGALAGAMLEVLTNPIVRSRLAIAMHKASQGSMTIPQAAAKVAGYANALGQAIDAESSSPEPMTAGQ